MGISPVSTLILLPGLFVSWSTVTLEPLGIATNVFGCIDYGISVDKFESILYSFYFYN